MRCCGLCASVFGDLCTSVGPANYMLSIWTARNCVYSCLVLAAASLMCVLWFGARQVIDGRLTPGQLSAFVVYSVYVSGNVGSLAGVFSNLMQVRQMCSVCLPYVTTEAHLE